MGLEVLIIDMVVGCWLTHPPSFSRIGERDEESWTSSFAGPILSNLSRSRSLIIHPL